MAVVSKASEVSQQDVVRKFFTGTSASYDSIVNLFTYGADRFWKKKILQKVPPSRRILDLACGTGILTFKLAKLNPTAAIVGVDMVYEYLEQSLRKKNRNGFTEVDFICAQAEQVQLRQTFDCITSSYIPKYVSAGKLLENITPILREGGVLLLHDFAYPRGTLFRCLWHLHMFLIKIIGQPLFPEWRTVFLELRDFVKSSQWIENYVESLKKFGYGKIQVERYTAGSAALISAVKKG